MVKILETQEISVSNSAGVWRQLFLRPTLSRAGVRLRVQSTSLASCFIALQPRGAGAPVDVTEAYADNVFVATERHDFTDDGKGDVEFWFLGDASGVATISAWELKQ